MRTVRLAAVLLALAGAATWAGSARADADPASDYLIGQQVFFPYDVKLPQRDQAELSAVVAAANKAGFKIRVAIIADSYDLGSVTALWKRPRLYARFLGQELAFVYKQRLLVVMPNGFGFNWTGHAVSHEYALLQRIPISSDATGLLSSAQTAVQRLAAADGVHVAAPANVKTTGSQTSHDRIVIIVIAIVALLVAVGVRFALRRRRRNLA